MPALTIHLLGGGFGESLVICMPNGKIGVIDCYSPLLRVDSSSEYRKHNPTLRFLRNDLKVNRLAFVAFTHPHEDHGRGLGQILEDYRNEVDEIWIFDAFIDIGLERYFLALFDAKRRLPIERLLDEEPGTFSEELLRIRNLVLEQTDLKNPSRATPRLFRGCQTVRIPGEDLVFHFLAPSVALTLSYKASILENIEGVVDDDGKVIKGNWKPEAINHNVASPAILCEYGLTRMILGGDVEQTAWQEAVADEHKNKFVPPCHFVKISHHGSVTGYTPNLYKQLTNSKIPIAALTPFNRHERPLPRSDAISHLSEIMNQVWTTSIEDANRAMGIIEPLAHHELLAAMPVLKNWKMSLDATPSLWGALDPYFVAGIGGPRTGIPTKPVPVEWISDLKANPRLATLLHPDLRAPFLSRPARTSEIEHAHRLSFQFDDSGNEVTANRYVGTKCGRLV